MQKDKLGNILLIIACLGALICAFATGILVGFGHAHKPEDPFKVCREIVSYVDTASPEERVRFFETIKTNHLQATQWSAICTMAQAADVQ